MLNTRRYKRTAVLTLFLIFFGLTAGGLSYALTPTPAQIEQFKAMSPDEQRALAKSFGIELPSSLGNQNISAPVSEPETVTPRQPVQAEEITTTVPDERRASEKEPVEETSGPEKTEKTEQHKLKPFGYELFAGSPTTFAPVTDIPIPVDYSIGPGDTIIVQLYGKANATYELSVSREGQIQFPELGPVSINGLNFGELKERINQLVSEQMIGVKASIAMGALRSIRVFVLGDAYRPGSYTVSALSTMTNALFASGGIQEIGSLRKIQLKRQGKVISTLDLYDLLLRGDTSNDKRLLPGDVIFIPTVGATAAVVGEVKRPAIYELKGQASMQELVTLAGGYSASAYPEASRVERIDAQGQRTVVDLDLSKQRGKRHTVRNGDVLTVYSVLDKLENIVVISGHVHRPGFFRWKQGLRVKNVLSGVADLLPNPDLSVALLKHETGPERLLSFELFDLGKALAGENDDNKLLDPRDEIIVFGAGNESRSSVMEKFVEVLQQQAPAMSFPLTAEIIGEVKSPGVYPIAKKMGVRELVRVAGGLKPNAQDTSALLVERTDRPGRFAIRYVDLHRQDELQHLSAGSRIYVLSSVENRANLLSPLIEEIQKQSWHGDRLPLVNVNGAVRFPGLYPYMSESTVADLVELAGGLREEAYLLSGEITRSRVKSGSEFEIFHEELDLTHEDATGMGFQLEPRDGLTIKRVPEWAEMISVTVSGEVRFPGKYPIVRGETLVQLLERAGGLTDEADPRGAVFLRESLREKEQAALTDMKEQLASDIAHLDATAAQNEDAINQQRAVGARLLTEASQAQALGRLVINLPDMLADKKKVSTLLLREGDQLIVPKRIQEVSIVGEVHHPTSYLYSRASNGKEYIRKSGGATRNGDVKRAYIISRDGGVKPLRKRILFFSHYRRVQPGDTIVVPLDVDKVKPITYWSQISQIVFQLATTAAALKTVGAI